MTTESFPHNKSLEERAREIAEQVFKANPPNMNATFLINGITEALLQFSAETREATIRECAEMCIAGNRFRNDVHNIRQGILSLLPKEGKEEK